MFLLVCLILGPAGAGSGEDSPSYVLQIHKVTSREDGTILLLIFGLSRRDVDFPCRDVNFTYLCHVATWTSHVATSIFTFSVTSRRGLPMSRRHFYKSLSRRDVHHHVATSVFTSLCHIATSPRTSRRWLHYSLSRRNVTPHVATWPCFKPKSSSFLALHLTHSSHRNPSFPAHQPSPDLPELPSHRSEVPPLLSDHLCASQSHPLRLVPSHCCISITLYSALVLVGCSRVYLHSQLVQGPLWSKFRVFLGFWVLSHS